MKNEETNRQTNHGRLGSTGGNKQIGNRAGEVLLLNFCTRLNGSNPIQHLC